MSHRSPTKIPLRKKMQKRREKTERNRQTMTGVFSHSVLTISLHQRGNALRGHGSIPCYGLGEVEKARPVPAPCFLLRTFSARVWREV